MSSFLSFFFVLFTIEGLLIGFSNAADPSVSYDFTVTYITASPLGVPQQVIGINNLFPGPVINTTTNYNVIVNVHNKLDEDFLLTWQGIQMRRNSYQDGVLGTTCPIPPKRNFTYNFQAKDQIGSFFYFPSLKMQRASGGFGSLVVNNRDIISIPFDAPYGEFSLLIGDWYIKNHTALRAQLDSGEELGMPDGVLINGKGPYRYDAALVPGGIEHEKISVDKGKTYRVRVSNVGISTSLNIRIQGHELRLVETEGYYTSQQNYSSFDLHVGQSSSFLVTMNHTKPADFYIVASARYVNETIWRNVTGVAILHYRGFSGSASGPLPSVPADIYDKWSAMNQPRSIRQNGTASGARPNPQGSYHYGSINVTHTYLLQSLPPSNIGGKFRAALNGLSFVNPDTPMRLADVNNVTGVYKLDFPDAPRSRPAKADTSIINATYKGFIEIIFQNNDTKMVSFHVNGYSFFVAGMDWGVWTENSRGSYNKWDTISRSTVEVYPGAWTAVFLSLDNVGVWNLRVDNLDRWYLGQETYMRLVNPEETGTTEYPPPENVRYCGALKHLQKDDGKSGSATSLRLTVGVGSAVVGLWAALLF